MSSGNNGQADLFAAAQPPDHAPLAEQMRPDRLDDLLGQDTLLREHTLLRQAIAAGKLHSMVLWGPPGCGKTSLARLLIQLSGGLALQLSAVTAGVREIREAVQQAEQQIAQGCAPPVLFVDEIHRFNKSQQDAFLPHIEAGTLILLGATTENPAFHLNNALLSRLRVYPLQPLGLESMQALQQRALQHLNGRDHHVYADIQLEAQAAKRLAMAADGDARVLLNMLEVAWQGVRQREGKLIDSALVEEVSIGSVRRFDRGGDVFYEQISALHKSVRGSDPDAALYWFCRMIDGGCDLAYLSRRLIRMASEDIGNADPRALELTLNATAACERLGSPEGELALAQAVLYMGVAAKSNATYVAYKAAMKAAKSHGSLPVPRHLRNAVTKLGAAQGDGQGYQYAHDYPDGFAPEQEYFPEHMPAQQYYQPVPRGLEARIAEKLQSLRQMSHQSKKRSTSRSTVVRDQDDRSGRE